MANLIEQMNVLKGLTDEHLQGELQAPSGSAPPFLVATEIARRKDMRKRYEQEAARMKPRTTVMDDLTAQPSMGPPMGAPPANFAEGGIVGYASGGPIDYDAIAQRYNDRLEGLSGDTDRARALALLAAGAGILGAKTSNPFTAVGQGAQQGILTYQDQIKNTDAEELALLRGITDIGQLQHSDSLAQLDQDFRERELKSQEERDAARLADDKLPAEARTVEWYAKQPPEVQAIHDKLYPPYNPTSATGTERLNDDLNRIFDNALKAVPDPAIPAMTPEEMQTQLQDKLGQARKAAYNQIRATYGPEIAANWAMNQGIDPSTLLIGGGAATGVDNTDPLGLGL